MILPELIALLKSAGVAWGLAPTPGWLRIDAPAGTLTPEIRAALAAHKAGLLALAEQARAEQGADGDRAGPVGPEVAPLAREGRETLRNGADGIPLCGPGVTSEAPTCPLRPTVETPEAPEPARLRRDLAGLFDRPPERTSWGGWAWSEPDAPPVQAFGPPPPSFFVPKCAEARDSDTRTCMDPKCGKTRAACDAPAPDEAPRPIGPPSWGLTIGGRVVALADRTPADERRDPLELVTGEGWPCWYTPAELDQRTVAP